MELKYQKYLSKPKQILIKERPPLTELLYKNSIRYHNLSQSLLEVDEGNYILTFSWAVHPQCQHLGKIMRLWRNRETGFERNVTFVSAVSLLSYNTGYVWALSVSINQHYFKQLLLHFQQALKLVAKHRWKLHTYVYICIRMYVFSVYLYRLYIYEYCLNPTMLSNNSKISVLSFTQLNSQHRTVNIGHWA